MDGNELIMVLVPMWSYKTTTLIHYMEKKQKQGCKVLVFSPEKTQRKDRPFLKDAIGIKWLDNIEDNDNKQNTLPLVASAKDFEEKVNKYDLDNNTWIILDELQFFHLDIIKVLKELKKKCNIITAGLDTNYTSRFFETPKFLAPVATQIIFKEASCFYCIAPAKFYEKKRGTQEGIGGADMYRPACYKCVHFDSKTLRW